MIQKTYIVHDEKDVYEIMNNVGLETMYYEAKSSMVVVYTNRVPKQLISQVIKILRKAYPKMIVTGISQYGRDKKNDQLGAKISFLFFESSDSTVFEYDFDEVTQEEATRDLREKLMGIPNLRGVQLFTHGRRMEISRFINELTEGFDEDVAFFGTKASQYLQDLFAGITPYLIGTNRVIDRGVLAVAYSGEDLDLMLDYRLGWKVLGRGVKAHVDSNRERPLGDTSLVKLDDLPAVGLYEKYLGIENTRNFLSNINEFPLILQRDGIQIVRVPFLNDEDGTLYFYGDIYENEELQLGYGSIKELIQEADKGSKIVNQFEPQCVFVFRCASREGLLGNYEAEEIKLYLRTCIGLLANTSSGEFYRWKGVRGVFSGAVVAVAMREGPKQAAVKGDLFPVPLSSGEEMLSLTERLTNYLTTSTAELNDMALKAQAANAAKTTFLSNMSHEIRTPITAILGMDDLILREELSPKVREYAINIHEAGNTLLSLVNDVLDFSKIEAGKMEPVNEQFDFPALLDDLDNMFRHRINAKGLRFDLQVDPRIPMSLVGDGFRLKQVLINILSNAVKYTDTGEISFRCVLRGDKSMAELAALSEEELPEVVLHFVIQDTGHGIRREDRERLFESFERLDLKHTRTIQGSGLGLNIVRKLLEMMGGELQLKSSYGVGSIFYFDIPLKRSSVESIGKYALHSRRKTEDTEYHESFHAPKASLLVVDDAMMNLMVIRELLKETGMHIDTASGGAEALAWMKQYTYDLVILDYQMPDMDGIETLQEIRKLAPDYCRTVPAICLTANAVEGAREQYIKAGFDDYVTKPIRPYLLEQVVMKYLPADKVEKVEAKDGEAKKKDGNRFIDRIQETSTISFPGWVFQIDEINVFSAISFCGSPEMFFASLQMFMKDSEALLSDLETLQKNRDGDAFAFHMHKLKSNSRLIGFDSASRLAEFMELCHKRGEMENFWYHTTDIIDMIRTVREELLEIDRTHENAFYVENDENRADEQPELSYEETIERLREMVAGFDYDSAAKMTENLEKVSVKPEELEFARRFREALDDFNWDSMQALMK